jgi:hypothetical protein
MRRPDWASGSGDADQMPPVDYPLPPALAKRMISGDRPWHHARRRGPHRPHLYGFVNQRPGNRVAVCVQSTAQSGLTRRTRSRSCPNGARPQSGFSAPASRLNRSILAGRAVEANARHFPHPLRQVRLECWPTRKTAARDRVVLHIAGAAFVLPFCPGAIKRTGSRREAPVAAASAVGKIRKLAAILMSGVVGYPRLAGADEDRILARLRT